jgi:protein-S-isoprenylcysteine O-methyltransferase Ste14
MRPKRPKNGNQVVELIIFMQSTLLVCFGLAAFNASSTIMSGIRAISDVNSMAAFVTDKGLQTETETISTDTALKIINNFELVCLISVSIGTIVMFATLVRIIRKSYGN